jgi:DNA end-binding protein Ku
MRSIWSGALSFGLINIPVRLYSGTEEHALSFDLLHKKDLSPIRYARICKEDGKEIPYQDIVKGYEYQKGEYVVVTEEDFKAVDMEKTNAIEIVQFTPKSEIDAIFYEKPYFLEPGKGADKPYALLRETLQRSKKVGVVKFVFRNREHLGIIEPYGNAIILNQMRFATEIRDIEELKLPKEGQISKKEVDMALKLVDQLTEKFKPEAFHDEYTEKLQKVIDAKVKGIPLRKKKTPAAKPSKVHDIMSLLKQSLEEPKNSKKQSRAKKSA